MARSVNRRNVGHAYERQVMHEMIDLGWPDCRTSRNDSRVLDAMKVDLTNTEPLSLQCKRWNSAPAYHKVLAEMPEGLNVILHKRPNKGEVAVMDKQTFYYFIKLLKQNNLI